jgi:hypothetical protein
MENPDPKDVPPVLIAPEEPTHVPRSNPPEAMAHRPGSELLRKHSLICLCAGRIALRITFTQDMAATLQVKLYLFKKKKEANSCFW